MFVEGFRHEALSPRLVEVPHVCEERLCYVIIPCAIISGGAVIRCVRQYD